MPTVDQCPYRTEVHTQDGTETATCGVLVELTGLTKSEGLRVPRAACEVCCRSEQPSPACLNPVVASFLYTLTQDVIERGGVPGCDLPRAEELQRLAFNNLEFEVDAAELPNPVDREQDVCYFLGHELGCRVRATARGEVRTPVFACLHPDHAETTAAQCRECRDWTAKPRPATGRLTDVLAAPEPSGATVPVDKWAVGVTTAPRRRPTLEVCLDSLRRAGWSEPRLFVDGPVDPPERFDNLPVSLRTPAVGAWPNYLLALEELLQRKPDADALMLVQDDSLFYDREDLRAILETQLPPLLATGVVSLYCPAAYSAAEFGWTTCDVDWEWGALAFVFPRQLAEEFVADRQVWEHRWTRNGRALIDAVVGKWARRRGVAIHYPVPSLVQHIGTTSTIWQRVPAAGYRRADQFVGDCL